ncbi:MAG TPA: hypothetical protein PKM72_07475 [Nitrospirales bacterium]|nr:hypothetical protein [Nitrospira sp. MA-1]HNP60662.1 hypothetical protein [Nitrospirales bacterium]
MRFWSLIIWFLLLFPSSALPEVWDFSCTEAVSLLRAAQDRVVRQHDQLQEAKFSLRHAPKEFDGCRRSRRGFQGGKIHCVTHQSPQGNLLRDILVAQRSLDASIQDFKKYQKDLGLSCSMPSP